MVILIQMDFFPDAFKWNIYGMDKLTPYTKKIFYRQYVTSSLHTRKGSNHLYKESGQDKKKKERQEV